MPTWSRQAEILQALSDCPRVAVRSGQKTGKSTSAVAAALWFASTRPRARVIFTAPTHRQIRAILWRELKHLYHNAKTDLGGVLHELPELGLQWQDGRELFGFFTTEAEKMAGISGPHVLFVVDEASGIPNEIYEAIEGNRAGGARIVMFSNPTQTSGVFYDAFNEKREFWKCIHVSSEEAAGTGIPGLATADYIAEKKREWGEDSPIYQVRIAGNFPAQSENAVVALMDIEGAIARYEDTEDDSVLSIGVDVARFGDDNSALCARRGKKTLAVTPIKGLDTKQLAGRVLGMVRLLRYGKHERVKVFVDVIGVGGGVADNLRDAHKEKEIHLFEVNVSNVAFHEEEYFNLRSELWFRAAKFLRDGGALPDDGALVSELVAPVYTFDQRGRRKVESKDDLKKRLGRSPDRADAFCLTFFGANSGPFKSAFVGGSRYDERRPNRDDEDDPDLDG